MKHWEITDTGLIRHENQDAFGFAQLPGGYAVAVVAGGSIASTVAVETFIRTLTETGHSGHTDRAVQEAVRAANAAIRQRAAGHPELKSMGTTLVSALVKGDKVLISNVGDSRAYLCESGAAPRRLTRDHSVVQMLVESGEISEEEARQHPKRNYITRALGVEAAVELEYVECAYTSGRLLLCTDGLYNYAPPEEHVDLIMTCESEQDIFLLIDEANKVGGPDNITAVIAAM